MSGAENGAASTSGEPGPRPGDSGGGAAPVLTAHLADTATYRTAVELAY